MEDRVEGNVLLSIVNKCVRLISKRHGVDIDIYSLPLDDPKVYDLIKADTSSDVFGLESHRMHACVTMVEPNELRHLIALQSFLKPYMAQKFSEYYKNKEEPDNIEYYSDIEEAILKESYGVLLYCEQAVDMIHQYSQIPIDISNTIVKYIRKNMREALDIWKPFFIFDTQMQGYTRSEAEHIWDRIKTAGEYTIHRRNAAYDAMAVYQCYWLKAYYPEEYKDALVPLVNTDKSW